jgi:hypothetical protein
VSKVLVAEVFCATQACSGHHKHIVKQPTPQQI